MKRFFFVIFLLVVTFIGGIVFGQYNDYSFFKSDKAEISVTQIKELVEDISELATVQDTITDEYYFEQDGIKVKNFTIPFTSKQLVVTCDTIVKIGSDLSKIDVKMSADNKKATITIPHSTILSSEIDEDSWKIQSQKDGLFNKVTVEDDEQLRKTIKKSVEKRVDEKDLYSKADKNTKKQITKFLQTAYPDLEVEVVFK